MATRLAPILLLAAVVLGCAGGGPGGAGVERIQKGMVAPVFALYDLHSREKIHSAKIIQSHHATVITIWSMACPNCTEALLEVQRVYEEYSPKSIAFIGVNFDIENIQGVRAFTKGEGIEFPTLWDQRRQVTKDFEALDYTFSVFVVDRRGTFVLAQYDHPPDLRQLLSKTLDDILE
jgi:peroxiredoxin